MAALCVCRLTLVTLLLLLCPGVLDACNQALDVTTPAFLEALSGSCLQIPCNFTLTLPPDTVVAFNVSSPIFGIWIISDHRFDEYPENVIFNSSLPNNIYPMHVTGDLKKWNCTTLFYNLITNYSNTYYFRIENRPYLATAVCKYLNIRVTDSPWSPSIKVSGDQTESEVVTITCSAVTPCPLTPPQLTWDLHQGSASITEINPNRTFTTKTKLNINLKDSHDGQMIKCIAAYPVSGGVKTADSNITLSVTYGPKNTLVQVSPSGSLSAGQSVTLNCSSRANPPVQTFTWFRHSSQGPFFVSEGHTYNFNLTEDRDFYCVASNALRNDSSSVIKLRIEEPVTPVGWEAILGAGIGLLIVLCLAVCVWYFRSKRKSSRETQGETSDKTAEEEESIHYGEIDFSKFSPRALPDTEQEETVYSQVQVSKPQSTQPTEDLEELYAKVNKK